ncbi:DUF6177 family protein [Actinomadura sp. 9N215]|uniref:DUF6177 family protein n=1 Tax=Actinomadura sp. 9N215 TaxID=3375150 RepID=UPI0037A39A78
MHPAVDVWTEKTGIVVQMRSVASLSVRVAEALRVCAENGREFVLATGAGRMTLPLRLMMGPGARWAVKSADQYYDGLSGVRLEWDGVRLVQGEEIHPAFADGVEPEGRQVLVTGTVRHRASETLVVGGVVDEVYRWFTGSGPEGWGTCEPAAVPWGPESVTEYCRGRAPGRTWIVHVGGGAIGTSEIVRADGGVEETFTVGVGVGVGVGPGEDEAPSGLEGLAEMVYTRYRLVSLTVQAMPGRKDLTAEPYFRGLPAPIGLALGRDGGGGDWFEVGDGRRPEDWERAGDLMKRLGVPRFTAMGIGEGGADPIREKET